MARRPATAAHRGVRDLERLLQDVPGIGPLGASVFCREVQGTWIDLAPYVDDRAAAGAAALRLPKTPERLASYVDAADLPRLVAACVRASLDAGIVADIRGR